MNKSRNTNDMENYEQKYKDALNWMRSIYPTMQGTDREDAEHHFPELKESEDERIRKEIIEFLIWLKEFRNGGYEPSGKYVIEDMIAWLEKQGEHKPAWSEEDETNMDAVWRACGQAYGTDYQGILGDWLKSLKERVQLQPKQEWSEEDKLHINNIISLLEKARDRFMLESCGQYPAWITDMIWLKSLKPQPKQEWSQEDEERYWSCLRRLGTGDSRQLETINSKWFKEHIVRQPHWKPNEKEMDDLYFAAEQLSVTLPSLKTLYEDLKAL